MEQENDKGEEEEAFCEWSTPFYFFHVLSLFLGVFLSPLTISPSFSFFYFLLHLNPCQSTSYLDFLLKNS